MNERTISLPETTFRTAFWAKRALPSFQNEGHLGDSSVLWITSIKYQWRQDQTKTCIPHIWLDFVRMKDPMWRSRYVAEETVAWVSLAMNSKAQRVKSGFKMHRLGQKNLTR